MLVGTIIRAVEDGQRESVDEDWAIYPVQDEDGTSGNRKEYSE